jgi:hypothetical protein
MPPYTIRFVEKCIYQLLPRLLILQLLLVKYYKKTSAFSQYLASIKMSSMDMQSSQHNSTYPTMPTDSSMNWE